MSKQSIYDKLSIPESQIPTIKGFTRESQEQIYAATVRAWLKHFGLPDQPISIDDPEVLSELSTWAGDQAERIQRVFNDFLLRAIDKLPDDATDEEILAALEADFFPTTRAYNRKTLIPYTSNWTRQQATNDFFEKNGLHAQTMWSCEPPVVTDKSCDVCINAIDDSPMNWMEAQQYEMPNHQNCPHAMIPTDTDAITLPTYIWTGQISSDQEAA